MERGFFCNLYQGVLHEYSRVPGKRDFTFIACDCPMLEINPLVVTAENDLIALDAKFGFDDNAVFRHPKIGDMRDYDEEDPNEVEASQHDLSYISLSGNIGCLVNGAGLAMA